MIIRCDITDFCKQDVKQMKIILCSYNVHSYEKFANLIKICFNQLFVIFIYSKDTNSLTKNIYVGI